jgi:hypothetical protein
MTDKLQSNQGVLAVPRGVELDNGNSAVDEIASHLPTTEIQDVTPSRVSLRKVRHDWYDSLQFPQSQYDFDTRQRDHTVYVVSCGPLVKIGVAVDPAKRFGALMSHNPFDMKMHAAWWLPFSVSRLAEAYCHAALEQYWVTGEWFNVDPQRALRVAGAVCLRAARSRGKFLQRVAFAKDVWDPPKRPGSARLLRAIKGYQPPPLFPQGEPP